MSYSVRLNDETTRKISRWRLSSHVIRELLKGLDRLGRHPECLVRIGPPHDVLQFDVGVREPGSPPRDLLFAFSVKYHADEETLIVYDCEFLLVSGDADPSDHPAAP
jgi:hypothetical protein